MSSSKNSLYVEMHSGVAGDMLISALLDFGLVGSDFLLAQLSKLNLEPSIGFKSEKTLVSGISATRSKFLVDEKALWDHSHRHEHEHRSYREILKILDRSSLSESVKNRSKSVFKTLALAEGAVHGVCFEDAHFHEVGSLDAIYDVVGFAVLFEALEIEKVYSSPFLLGRGEVHCAHGVMPVPVPAVVKILEGRACPSMQVRENTGELTTPTGCAIVATYADGFGLDKNFKINKVGYGAGHKVIASRPNALRLSLINFEEETRDEVDQVYLVEANIDDMSGELLGDALSTLMERGALDAWVSPIFMKKSRGAYKMSFLCEENDLNDLGAVLFENTSSIGYRHRLFDRVKLKRENIEIFFEGHALKAKKVFLPNGKSRVKVEYEDKKSLAKKLGRSVLDIDAKLSVLLN